MLNHLRFGQGLDNRRLKATGYRLPLHDPRDRRKLREHQRVEPLLRDRPGQYRYEREVEDFLRRSPSVRRETERDESAGAN